jgi:hypothetical protein
VRRVTTTSPYWIALVLMAMVAMITLATLGVFSSPASAQGLTDCPDGTLPIIEVEASPQGNEF